MSPADSPGWRGFADVPLTLAQAESVTATTRASRQRHDPTGGPALVSLQRGEHSLGRVWVTSREEVVHRTPPSGRPRCRCQRQPPARLSHR